MSTTISSTPANSKQNTSFQSTKNANVRRYSQNSGFSYVPVLLVETDYHTNWMVFDAAMATFFLIFLNFNFAFASVLIKFEITFSFIFCPFYSLSFLILFLFISVTRIYTFASYLEVLNAQTLTHTQAKKKENTHTSTH